MVIIEKNSHSKNQPREQIVVGNQRNNHFVVHQSKMQPSANHFKILYLHLVRKFNLVLWCLKLRFQTWENHSKSLFSLGRAKQDINFRISKAIISVLQSSKRFTERKRDYSSLSILYLVSISKIKRHEGNLTHTNMDHESHKYQYTQIISLPTIF